jgi:hypothetical protein
MFLPVTILSISRTAINIFLQFCSSLSSITEDINGFPLSTNRRPFDQTKCLSQDLFRLMKWNGKRFLHVDVTTARVGTIADCHGQADHVEK